jgi:hypothetical protein
MGLQTTASKTALLLQCSRPFAEDVALSRESGAAANYGSAFHGALEAVVRRAERCEAEMLKKWAVSDATVEELRAHVDQAYTVLLKWCNGDNPFGAKFSVTDTEKHLATKIRRAPGGSYASSYAYSVASRECDFDEATHHYDLRKGEMGGTFDLLLRCEDGRLCVLDYKTGDWGNFMHPSELPQMRTLALQTSSELVAILHTPRNLPAVVYAEEISAETLSQHIRALSAARRRIGDGSLRPGFDCKYCEAKDSCPAKDGELLERSGALIQGSLSALLPAGALTKQIDLGRFHMLLGELDKLQKRAREEMKQEVAAGAVIERPDGKVLVLEEREYERLSKASILEALGKKEGEKMLESLRKKGAFSVEKRTEMHARKG